MPSIYTYKKAVTVTTESSKEHRKLVLQSVLDCSSHPALTVGEAVDQGQREAWKEIEARSD